MVPDRLQDLHRGFLVIMISAVGLMNIPGGRTAQGSVWQSYSTVASQAAEPSPQTAPAATRQSGQPFLAVDDPRFQPENRYGFPRHKDPLFDENPLPSWQPMIENKPKYDRPDYAPPDVQAPNFGLAPVREPAYQMPLAILPNADKPRYNFNYVEAPAYLAPTYNAPVEYAPNYVIKPDIPPTYGNLPSYDKGAIFYSRPEYQAPVYKPQEYIKPREVAPPLIAPPR